MLNASVKTDGKVAIHSVKSEAGWVLHACWRKTSAADLGGKQAVLGDMARLLAKDRVSNGPT